MATIQRSCQECAALFIVSEEEQTFLSNLTFPLPEKCFKCGQKQRLSFRNSSSLYNRKCDFSGEAIISFYSPDKPYKVYKSDYWFGDKWDGIEYGQEYDFTRSFTEQMKELQLKVPRLALLNFNAENSDYCNSTVGNKNCYLIFGGDFNEDCMFGNLIMHSQNTVDSDFSNQSKICYMLSDCTNCYESQFVLDSKNCSNAYFLSDCSNCQNCILCTNLHNKSYCIRNQQLSKEEYEKQKKELMNGSYNAQQQLLQEFRNLRSKRIVKFSHTLSCEDSSGDYLQNCKSCHNCYDSSNGEDLQNVIFASEAKDTINSSMIGHNTQLCHEVISTVNAYTSYYSFGVLNSSNIYYSDLSLDSHDLFGCISLRKKEYCILNKQYTKEAYEALIPRIIEHMQKTGEWGKFLSKELSYFGYNETSAHEYYPLKKEEALAAGYKWYDKDNLNIYQGPEVSIPDDIVAVHDDITKEILTCNTCKKNYRIVPQELTFYREHLIPLPRVCHVCRYNLRQSFRNPKKLWERACQKCGVSLKTTYAPERPETVYCEKCYLETIY